MIVRAEVAFFFLATQLWLAGQQPVAGSSLICLRNDGTHDGWVKKGTV